jgi:hypothetical protein
MGGSAAREALCPWPSRRETILTVYVLPLLAGDGVLDRELDALAGSLGVADRVRFLGFMTLPVAFKAVDAFRTPFAVRALRACGERGVRMRNPGRRVGCLRLGRRFDRRGDGFTSPPATSLRSPTVCG